MSTVLIVEDDANIAKALKTRLVHHGFNVLNAYDAASAPTIAKQGQPDVAILDISMPAGDGFLVAERLKSILGHELPTIFITANTQPGLKEKAETLGAVAFFEKPYHSADLMKAVTDAARAA